MMVTDTHEPSAYRRALLGGLVVFILTAAATTALVSLSVSAINRASSAFVAGKAQALEASLKHMLATLAAEAKDYAVWEETFSFVQEPDPKWAANNLDWIVEGLGLSGVAVIQPDGSLVFANGSFAKWPEQLQSWLLGHFRDALLESPNWETTFYNPDEARLYLLAGSRIVHEWDDNREGEYAGFLVLAQALTEEHRAEMANLIGVRSLSLELHSSDAAQTQPASAALPYALWLSRATVTPVPNELMRSRRPTFSARVTELPLQGYLGPPGLAIRYEALLPLASADVQRLYLTAGIAAAGVLIAIAASLVAMQYLVLQPTLDLAKAISQFGSTGSWQPPAPRFREFAVIVDAFSHAIASRLAAEQRERERAQELRLLLDTLPAFIFSKDREGRYLAANRTLCQLLGLPEEAIIGKTDAELFPPEVAAQFRENDRRAMEAGEAIDAEEKVRVDGQELLVRVVKAPLRDSSGEVCGVLGLAFDITQQRKLERALQASQKMEILGQLASGVAHDFNNVLTTIFTGLDMALRSLPATSEVYADLMEVRRAAERASQMTRQLLLLSRSKAAERHPLDINEVLNSLAKMLRRLLGEDINLQLEVAPDAPWVLADCTQLEQVVLNLALNAREAMPKGGALTISAAPQEREGHPYLLLSVKDTGTGIPPELRERIFEPFFTTKRQGTGLGLNIVQSIVSEHQGQIWFDTTLGKGTTFYILLPAAGTAPRPERPLLEQPPSHPAARETILLVEDEAPVRLLTERVLTKHGYQVFSATNAKEALELWPTLPEPPALLISDVVMPGMNGYELARRLQQERPELKVLLVSGYSQEVLTNRQLPLDGMHLIAKPYTPATLLQAIREALGQT